MAYEVFVSLDDVLCLFRDKYEGWNLAHMENFVAIAIAGSAGITHNELAKKYCKPSSTNVLPLQKLIQVYGLVDSFPDPTERRRLKLVLSAEGKNVAKMVMKFLAAI